MTERNGGGARCRSLLRQTAWAFLLATIAHAGFTKETALLVGVSGYPEYPSHLRLKGPMNDVRLFGDVLREQGFSAANITILADQVPGSHGNPTREAILTQLNRIGGEAAPGDRVVLYFSGHGSRQPADPATIGVDSYDGFDAIFLPYDAGFWDPATGSVKNALTNHELRSKVEAILARGAFVWVVADSCHSAYMVRAFNHSVRARSLSAADLKIPPELVSAASQRGNRVSRYRGAAPEFLASRERGYVAFLASQSTEPTFELPQPASDADAQIHGLFTFNLAVAMRLRPAAALGWVGDQVLKQYAEHGRMSPTPLLIGSGLEQSVLGVPASESLRQWRISVDENGNAEIPAGSVHRLGSGSLLAVLPSAVARVHEATGFVTVTEPLAFRSRVTATGYKDRPPLPSSALHGQFARLVAPGIPFTLKVALPAFDLAAAKDWGTVGTALASLKDSPQQLESRIEWVDACTADADVALIVDEQRIRFLTGGAAAQNANGLEEAPAIRLSAPDLPAQIANTLATISKALNLVRLATELKNSDWPDMTVALSLVKSGAPAVPVRFTDVPVVSQGDTLTVEISNKGSLPVDVSALYIDSRFGITALFPHRKSMWLGRIAALTGVGHIPIVAQTESQGVPSTLGVERLVLIVTRAEPNTASSDFQFLSQATLPKARGAQASLRTLLINAGFSQTGMRGATVELPLVENTWMQVFTWRVEEKSQRMDDSE